MAQYEYQGMDESGISIRGAIEATDRRSAIRMLTEKGCFVTQLLINESGVSESETIEEGYSSSPADNIILSRISSKDVLSFTSQLSTALQAGLPLLNCLGIIKQQAHKPAHKQLIIDLEQAVSSGESLSEALAAQPRVFGPLYIAMIRVGETGGILEQTTEQLVRLLKRDEKIKTNMKNAAAYPLFVLGLGLVSIVFIITKVLPKIVGTIQESGVRLPWPTRLLLSLSDLFWSYPGLLGIIGFLVFYFLLRIWICSPGGRIWWDIFKLRLPIFGNVLRTVAVGRFTRTLGALTKGGVTILEALSVVRNTLGNESLGREIDQLAQAVKSGEPLAQPLSRSGKFPPLLVQIVSVGEQTGKLDELLLNAAETFDEEADAAITRFMTLLPSVLIVLLAVVIGFVIAAILMPIVVMQLGV